MLFSNDYFKVQANGISPFQTMVAYLGGSAFQTVIDNPITSYRQLVQQYAKDLNGQQVSPTIARQEANAIFRKAPISASLSGLGPRLIGVGFKRVPKFGFFLGISYFLNEGEQPGLAAATAASIFSAPFINPVRMVEKQQRAYFRETGAQKPLREILRESAGQNFRPLLRGTLPLMGHSLASATTGLVGQPILQRKIERELGAKSGMGQFGCNLVSSAMVTPIYVAMTNPLSRLEVIMQTNSIKDKPITLGEAVKEVARDSREFGLRGMFRGQGLGIAKAIVSLSMFHQGRLWLADSFKSYNRAKL